MRDLWFEIFSINLKFDKNLLNYFLYYFQLKNIAGTLTGGMKSKDRPRLPIGDGNWNSNDFQPSHYYVRKREKFAFFTILLEKL